MITDRLFQLFVRTLGAHKHVKRGPITRFDWAGVPTDVGRVLDAVGGWRYGDFRFAEAGQLEGIRETWSARATEFEEGRSDNPGHAFWNRAWIPLAVSATEVYAFDPIGCFGGAREQIVTFAITGRDTWRVYPAISAWLTSLTEGFETESKEKDALDKAYHWARANRVCVEMKLPPTLDEQRSPQRFESGIGRWIELRHPDGRCWAVRERRDGYELRVGEGEDAVTRKRPAPNPTTEVRRLVREQKAEGFLPV